MPGMRKLIPFGLAVVLVSTFALAQGDAAPAPADIVAVQPASAPDAGVSSVLGDGFQEDLAAVLVDPTSERVAVLLLRAVMTGQWGLFISLLLTAVVAGLRKWIPASTKFGGWMRTKLGAVITTFLLALGGGFVTQFAAGVPFSLALVLKALSIAVGAAGGWTLVKNIHEAVLEARAVNVGVKAAEAPADTLNK
jgi:hypothetical protein